MNVNFADTHAKSYSRSASFGGTAADPLYSGAPDVRVYNLPYDLNGIPGVLAEPRM